MSGLPEIIQWVRREIDLQLFNTTSQAYEAISAQFVSDGRNDLDNILLDQKESFLAFLRSKIEGIKTTLEPDTPQQFDILETVTQGMIALFG